MNRRQRDELSKMLQASMIDKIIHAIEHSTVACVICGIPFMSKRSDAKFCSDRCRQKHFRAKYKKARA